MYLLLVLCAKGSVDLWHHCVSAVHVWHAKTVDSFSFNVFIDVCYGTRHVNVIGSFLSPLVGPKNLYIFSFLFSQNNLCSFVFILVFV